MSNYEKSVRNAVMDVICNAMNFPKAVSVHILGQDMGPLGDKITDAILPPLAKAWDEGASAAYLHVDNRSGQWIDPPQNPYRTMTNEETR